MPLNQYQWKVLIKALYFLWERHYTNHSLKHNSLCHFKPMSHFHSNPSQYSGAIKACKKLFFPIIRWRKNLLHINTDRQIHYLLNDAHMERTGALLKKFIETRGWLFLTFFMCLHNQLSSFNSIIVQMSEKRDSSSTQ